MNKEDSINLGGAAIVCAHVAKSRYPILVAARDEPAMPEDTGWQFLCNRAETEEDAQVWSLGEVVDLEPSLAGFVNCPVGTTIMREDQVGSWKIVEGGDCEI